MIASTHTNHPMALSPKNDKTLTHTELACARLRAAGMRITQPRIAILTSLINRSMPANMQQIHSDLPEDTCDLVTIYRCLSAFQKIGLVRLSYFHNGASAYQITLTEEPAPYHVITKNNNNVDELDAESATELRTVITAIEKRLQAKGYGKVSHIVEFFVEAENIEDAAGPREGVTEEIPAIFQARTSAPVAI